MQSRRTVEHETTRIRMARDESVDGSDRLPQTLRHLSLAALFVVFPLASRPWATTGIDTFYASKAVALGLVWAVVAVAVLANYRSASLRDFARAARRPFVLVSLLAATWVLTAAWMNSGAAGLFGSIQRYDGAIFFATWLTLLPLLGALGAKFETRTPILVYMSIGGVAVGAWALMETYGFQPASLFSSVSPNADPRTYGAATLGHRGHVTMFVTFVSLIAAVVVVRNEVDRRTASALGIVAVILAFTAFSTGGRAAWVGFVVGWAGFALVQLMNRYLRGDSSHRISRLLVMSAIYLVIATLAVQINPLGQARFDGFRGAVEGSDNSLNSRFVAWRAGLRVVGMNPVVGLGPEKFSTEIWEGLSPAEEQVLYGNYFPRRLVPHVERHGTGLVAYDASNDRVEFRAGVFDKAHNYLLDLAILFGLPAVAALILLALSGIGTSLRSDVTSGLAIAAAFIAYFVHGLAWFPTLQLDPILWGTLALFAGTSWTTRRKARPDTPRVGV